MNHYPHHIGDFDRATRHLSRIERSIYRDLLDVYYDTEQPLTLDLEKLKRKILATTEQESTAVEQVLNEFFTKTPTGWFNSRCDDEILRYLSNNSQKALAGKASAAAKARRKQEMLNGSSTHVATPVEQTNNGTPTNQEPRTKNQEPKKDKSAPLCVAVSVLVEKGFDEQTAEEFIAHKTKIEVPLTARAWSDHLSESEKAGWTPKAAAEKVMAKNWKGFEAKYVANEPKQGAFTPAITTPSREAIDPIMAMAIQESARTFKPVTEIYKSMKNKALGVAA